MASTESRLSIIIGLVAGLLFIGGGFFVRNLQAREAVTRREARGTIVDHQSRRESNGDTAFAAVIEFADASGERYRALGEYKSFKESLGNAVVISYDPASPAASARGVDPLEGLTPLAMFGIGGFAVLYSLWGAIRNLNHKGTKTQRNT